MNTKRILQLNTGETPDVTDQFLCIQDMAATPITRRLSFSVLLTLFSTLHKGAWSGVTTYAKGEIVERNGASYQCIATTLNNAPPNATYWRVIAEKGATGAAGSTWYADVGEPASELGSNGDFYFQTENSNIYKKASGTWSILANIEGAMGDIREWLVGSGAPTSQGENGDWYLDSGTGDIYGPKASDEWPGSPAANIRGPEGPTGPEGGSGPTGGTVGQVWFKLSSDDYDGEWRTVAIGDISGLTAALAAKASTLHASTHSPGGSDAIAWTTVHGRGATGSKPTASASNAGYLYFDTTLGKLQRSNGSSWEDVSETGGGGSDDETTLTGTTATATPLNLTTIALQNNQAAKFTAQVVGRLYPTGTTWTARDSTRSWKEITSSADGTKLAAVVINGQIYTSADSGATWTARDSSRNWSDIDSSEDGTKLVASCYVTGQLYTSTDSGVNWTARDIDRNWTCCASSADGTKLAACSYSGPIYTSDDSGVTWTARSGSGNRIWMSICSSADGTKLAATVTNGKIYTSNDSGANWTERDSDRNWCRIACSSDGTKLIASVIGGYLYTSADSGATWTQRETSRNWRGVASSDDGTRLAAADLGTGGVNSGLVFVSTDSGATWSSSSISLVRAIASSSNGLKLAACVRGGQIYTSVGGSGAAGWDFSGVIARGPNAGATAFQGTAIKDDATGANPSGMDADVLADTTGGGLRVAVTGPDGITVDWKASVKLTTV